MYSQPQAATLIDALLPTRQLNRRITRDVLLIVGFSLFTALMARFVIHLAFTPVPITGQTLAVLLTGATLGSRRGAAALALYMVEGSVFPVFSGGSGADLLFQANAGGYIFGLSSGSAGLVWDLASGGYIIGFIPAAYIVGYLCERGWDRQIWILLAMGAGNIVLYIPGLIQLSLFVPNDKVLEFGLYPFIFGDLAKLYVASLAVPSAWTLAGRLGGNPKS